jgi:hypothetical protein
MGKLLLLLSALITMSCSSSSSVSADQSIDGEILIDLIAGYDSKEIEESFSKYNLKKERVISASLNIILCKFDSEKIAIEKLIIKVKKDKRVEEAQSNKKINNRR